MVHLSKSGGLAVDHVVELFPNGPELRKVTIEWEPQSIISLIASLSSIINESDPVHRMFKSLNLRFSHGQPVATEVKCAIKAPVCSNSLSFWARELEKYLPGSAVTVECDEGEYWTSGPPSCKR